MEIPLFPLHTVLFPGVALPLHIFEDRYRALVAHCLETKTPFGVVLIRDGREVGGGDIAIAGIGTFAAIREAERHPDGRYDLLAVGIGRFAVSAVETDREPYFVATVEPLPERSDRPADASRLVRRVTRRFVDYLRLVRPQEGEEGGDIDVRLEVEVGEGSVGEGSDPDIHDADADAGSEPRIVRRIQVPDDPGTLAHLLSGIVQIDLLQKQALLEADTVEDRLTALETILDQELLLLRRRLRRYDADPRSAAARRN